MVATIEVRGAEQMRVLGKELRAMGLEGKGLRRELLAGMRVAAKPLLRDAKQSALDTLPKSGGLNVWVGSSKMAVRNRLAGNGAGVRLVSSRGSDHNLDQIDRGIVRHKVWGKWLPNIPDQHVPPGWWTKPLNKGAPKVQLALLVAMSNVTKKIARG